MTIDIAMPLAVILLSLCVLAIGVEQDSLFVFRVCFFGSMFSAALAGSWLLYLLKHASTQ